MSLFRRLIDTIRAGRLNRELDEEMRFHLDMRAEGYQRKGLSPADARREALRRFGSPLGARERVRDVRLLTWLDSVRQDLLLGLRLLRRSPALTAAIVLSLGLSIGATTGVLAVGDAVLLRPLPVERPEGLRIFQWRSTEWPDIGIWGNGDGENSWSFSYPMFEDFRRTPGVDVAGFQDLNNAVTQVRGVAGTADGSLITGNYFTVLGVRAEAGRMLTPSDDVAGADPAVVVSHRFWQREFGGAPAVVGASIHINGRPYTVVGVAPRSFFGMQPGRWTDFYLPSASVTTVPQFSREGMLTSEKLWWLQLVARLEPGASPSSVQAALATQFNRRVRPFITASKQNATFGMRPGSRGFAFLNNEAGKAIGILGALVALVLLIACANVANLLLSRVEARRREAATRLALGAGRLRLVRQHLTESLLLALVSGVGGAFFARWFAQAILALAPEKEALVVSLGFDPRAVAFGVALSIAVGLLVGLVPAVRTARADVSGSLHAGTRIRTGWSRRLSFGRPLVGVQIALSLLLLVVAGLFVRSVANLQAAPLGFRSDGLVLFNLDPAAAGYSPEQKAAATARLAARLRQLPGVSAVSWSSMALLDDFSWNTRLTIDGEPGSKDAGKGVPPCNLLWVGPGFHQVLGIPLVAGRLFDERDERGGHKVALVNRAFVAKFLKGSGALGRVVHLDLEGKPETIEIVGVVGDTKYSRIRREKGPILFMSEPQHDLTIGPAFVLAATGDHASLGRDITRLVHETEPALPVSRIRTFNHQLAQQLAMERSLSLVASAFGVVALLLAAIGLYGVVAFAVARRTAEMGVRLALGASPGTVLRLVLSDSARVVVPGALVGVAVALGATRLVRSVLYGLEPTDPMTILAAAGLLLVVAGFAAFLPARRAAGIHPADALRCE
jgi:predicted permease